MNAKHGRDHWQLLIATVLSVAMFGNGADAQQGVDLESFKPKWQVGQQWVVETVIHQTPARRDLRTDEIKETVRWQFHVQEVEKIDQRDCFRVRVKCLVDDQQPVATFWVDRETMTLRRVATQVLLAGGFHTLTENYRSSSDQPFPAFSPLTVPPLELPLFLAGTKGTQTFNYEASSGPTGVKAVGEIDFAIAIEQHVTKLKEDKVKGLLPEQYTKDLAKKPTAEVQLKAGSSQVRQLWQPDIPWPVYSNNGIAESRLIEVTTPPQESPF